jgi:hypothetical protein
MFYKTYEKLFTLKFYTIYIDQCGRHLLLKILYEETAVFCIVS